MGLRKIIKMFNDGNVFVVGLRGRGKDMLMSNVCVRRELDYVSNINYGGKYHVFNANDLDCGKNTYKNFLSGDINYYKYPFPDGTDIYLSDCGSYFPSQYCNELNKMFPHLVNFPALSRHLGSCNIHCNAQNITRVWDKLREQSDTYIMCLGCVVIFGFVFQLVRIYDKYDSCVARLKPFSVKAPLLSSAQTKMMVDLQRQTYECTHGKIQNKFLVYRNKSKYNTRFFRDLLLNGKKVTT